MWTPSLRTPAVLALLGLVCLGCGGGGGGGNDQTLHFVSAGIENEALQTSADTPFEVTIDNQTGEVQWSVALQVWVVQGGSQTLVYDWNVMWCGGGTAQVAPGACTTSGVIQSINTSQFAGASSVTLSFRLFSMSDSTYYDTFEQTVHVQ